MSTPVVTDKWAGNFDCDVCRRKRLMGSEFSKKALDRYRKEGGRLKCKNCVAKTEEAERQKAAARRQQLSPRESPLGTTEKRLCVSCRKELEQSSFNKNQWSKGEGKSRCRNCVEKSLKEQAENQKQNKDGQISLARERVEQAKRSGNPAEILKAESALAALEAEKVTGLKPVKLGRGGGRGGGRGRGTRSRGGGGRIGAGRGRGGRR